MTRKFKFTQQSSILMGLAALALVILGSWALWHFYWVDTASVNHRLEHIDQHPSHYLAQTNADQPIWSPKQQKQNKKAFLKHYFSPWHDSIEEIFKKALYGYGAAQKHHQQHAQQDDQPEQKDIVTQFREGMQQNAEHFKASNNKWGNDLRQWPETLTQQVIDNAQLDQFPNRDQPGITVHSSEVRVWPTLFPQFSNPFQPGEGYPFDYMQSAHVEANKPLRILQVSQDGKWYCVKFAGYYGWIQTRDVAQVDQDFIEQWEQGPFAVAVEDGQPLYHEDVLNGQTRLGMLYPKQTDDTQSDQHQPKLYSAFKQPNGQARIISVHTNAEAVTDFPLHYTPRQLARLAEPLMGHYYGWGSIRGTRDCSATIRDLLAPFAVWLPRNSSRQAQMIDPIDLHGLSNKQKLQTIKQKGQPFATLINLKGHVGLYVGTYGGRVYMLHDTWALKLSNLWGQKGRAIIGRTVITPVSIGQYYLNTQYGLLDKTVSITNLKPMQ